MTDALQQKFNAAFAESELYLAGDELARRMGYKYHSGIDAVEFYLIDKHGWLPSHVRTLSVQDLRFLISEDLAGWKLSEREEELLCAGLGFFGPE